MCIRDNSRVILLCQPQHIQTGSVGHLLIGYYGVIFTTGNHLSGIFNPASLEYSMTVLLQVRRKNPPHVWLVVYDQYSRHTCLLYTSDAADEEDSVDLGGR